MTNNTAPAGLSSSPRYRVVADRDKGDDPRPSMLEDGDRVTVVAYNAHDDSWEDGNEGIVRIERLVPTTEVERFAQAVADTVHDPGASFLDALADATAPSVPTREQIESAVGAVLFNVSNYPKNTQSRLWGQDIGPLRRKVTDAVLALIQKGTDRG